MVTEHKSTAYDEIVKVTEEHRIAEIKRRYEELLERIEKTNPLLRELDRRSKQRNG